MPIKSAFGPVLLVSEGAQLVGYNRVVDLETKKTLVLIHQVAHVDNEE